MSNNNINEIDIRPESSIYATYQRLSYKPTYALAEFVDNSTASYFEHEEELKEFYKKNGKDYKLKIYVLYSHDKSNSIIKIRDNAYGMEIENFKRAVVLGNPPVKKGGRNEFGMGLKTAATWFSKKWTIRSTQLGSNKEYAVTMDIEELKRSNPSTLPIKTSEVEATAHYTELVLEDLLKPFATKKQKQTVAKMITGMYRRDIRNNNIQIVFAENKDGVWCDFEGNVFESLQKVPAVKFTQVKPRTILPGQVTGIHNETLCVGTFEDSFEFAGETHLVKFLVGIRDVGSRKEAGFTLFRRNRAIIGGYEDNYRPREIFGDASSFVYQRLYGEIDVDSFPVNQAKDGFSWDDGLEDAFIDFLNRKVGRFKIWATQLRKSDESGAKKVNTKLNKEANEEIKKMLKTSEVKTVEEVIKDYNEGTEIPSELITAIKNDNNGDKKDTNIMDTVITNKSGDNELSFAYFVSEKVNPKNWITISIINESKGLFSITLFVEHKFLKPFAQEPEFIIFMKKFSLAYASAILDLKTRSLDGKVDPLLITNKINEYLLED
ncbi:hypothetical protein SCHIN_v1c08210 [Spiroplasma chinense]|uniref:ATP-binding protein n=1 Tax=Spiroplasma chinense TaxID=216932 RepID=A0A5B9Y5L5_9MOLU|nr:ATP-binding protein [Spiroplasma chinense]QEH62016.1 hypothetical protein SCHIN_v1c08210 [Spiroplasma chinense]